MKFSTACNAIGFVFTFGSIGFVVLGEINTSFQFLILANLMWIRAEVVDLKGR